MSELTELEQKLLDAIDAKNDLLVCYRIGSRPTESLRDRLRVAEETINIAKARAAQAMAE